MGVLKGLVATMIIIGGIVILFLLMTLFQNYKIKFQQKYHRSFYHLWAILSWMALPLSLIALSAGVSGEAQGDQLWFGWIPIFSLLAAYLYYMARYGKREGFTVITLQIIPACLAIWILVVIFLIIDRVFEQD